MDGKEKEFCPHCGKRISRKTFLAHKRLYYDCSSNQWIKRREVDSSDFPVDDLEFEESEDTTSLGRVSTHESDPPPVVDFDDAEPNPFEDEEEGNHELYIGNRDLGLERPIETTEETGDIEVWEEEGVEEDLEDMTAMSDESTSDADSSVSLVLWLVHFIALLQKKHYLPDAALALLLRFLSVFFIVLGRIAPQVSGISQHFPSTLYQLQKLLGTHKENFVRYVTCQKSHSVYKYSDCIETIGTRLVPKLCTHRNSAYGHPCGGALLRSVELLSKKRIYYPISVYCYMPLYNSFQTLLDRAAFHKQCDHWKVECREDGIYKDVYDGKVWQDFQTLPDGKPFLSDPFTYGLMLNIDWFRPCKHTEYSIGAIYLTIMNLPRTVRFRQENVILVGLIPGPHEPKLDINAFLSPLVEELLKFWKGVEMHVHSFSKSVLIRCALLCVACDIPASRKVCGFLGHTANLGCSKCLKRFPGGFGKKDYSGFDRIQWPMRNLREHRQNVSSIRQCTTKTGRSALESKYGCRYSILLDLPYFDPIRMTIIDPMHNLYLGTAKHMLKNVWIEQGFITNRDMSLIQSRVDSVQVPLYVGRIPHKIASSFSGFTADQFKNWTNLFSLMALRDILPAEHLQSWCLFVLASRILCQMKITDAEIKLADALLLQFCCRVERLYSKEVITPNMHLHCHLKQSLYYDYGPIHNFWLFSYERYNGILEHFPSNKRSFEIHLMQRFLQEFRLFTTSQFMPQEFESDFGELFKAHIQPTLQGSLQVTIHGKFVDRIDPRQVKDWSLASTSEPVDISFPKSYVRSSLCDSTLSHLKCIYSSLYPTMRLEDIDLNTTVRKYSSIAYRGMSFRSNSTVYATNLPCHSLLTNPATCNMKPRPVLLRYFILHAFHYKSSVHQHVFAAVSWLKEHHAKEYFGKPLEVWWKELYDNDLGTFIPVQLLFCHSVHCDIKHEEQTVCLMCPVHHIPAIM